MNVTTFVFACELSREYMYTINGTLIYIRAKYIKRLNFRTPLSCLAQKLVDPLFSFEGK